MELIFYLRAAKEKSTNKLRRSLQVVKKKKVL
jgi:hypothetical protein